MDALAWALVSMLMKIQLNVPVSSRPMCKMELMLANASLHGDAVAHRKLRLPACQPTSRVGYVLLAGDPYTFCLPACQPTSRVGYVLLAGDPYTFCSHAIWSKGTLIWSFANSAKRGTRGDPQDRQRFRRLSRGLPRRGPIRDISQLRNRHGQRLVRPSPVPKIRTHG